MDITALLSPVSRLARHCTQPKVQFDTFTRLKRGEEKLIGNFFYGFYNRKTGRFHQGTKKYCHIHFNYLNIVEKVEVIQVMALPFTPSIMLVRKLNTVL